MNVVCLGSDGDTWVRCRDRLGCVRSKDEGVAGTMRRYK